MHIELILLVIVQTAQSLYASVMFTLLGTTELQGINR
jgi:hypothetical protein